MKFCIECGNTLDGHQRFCDQCGTPVEYETSSNVSHETALSSTQDHVTSEESTQEEPIVLPVEESIDQANKTEEEPLWEKDDTILVEASSEIEHVKELVNEVTNQETSFEIFDADDSSEELALGSDRLSQNDEAAFIEGEHQVDLDEDFVENASSEASQFCFECGAKNQVDAQFCNECGTLLDVDKESDTHIYNSNHIDDNSDDLPFEASESAYINNREPFFCGNCGHKNYEGDVDCENCGKFLLEFEDEESAAVTPLPSTNVKKSSTKPKFLWPTLAAAILLLGGIGIIFGRDLLMASNHIESRTEQAQATTAVQSTESASTQENKTTNANQQDQETTFVVLGGGTTQVESTEQDSQTSEETTTAPTQTQATTQTQTPTQTQAPTQTESQSSQETQTQNKTQATEQVETQAPEEIQTTEQEETTFVVIGPNGQAINPEETSDLSQAAPIDDSALHVSVQAAFDSTFGQSGISAIYFKRLTDASGQSLTTSALTTNNEVIRAASIIKLYILTALYHQVANGQLDLNTTYYLSSADKVGGTGTLQNYGDGTGFTLFELAQLMIANSDNTAANVLINYIGGLDVINNVITSLGYNQTRINRKLMDLVAVENGIDNYTTAYETGDLLARLYNKQLISPDLDQSMLSVLQYPGDGTKTKFMAAGLPAGTIYYNKTGQNSQYGIANDAMIVDSPQGAYVIVALTYNGSYDYQSEQITQLSRQVYYLFNP